MNTDAIGKQNVSNDDKQNTVSVSTVFVSTCLLCCLASSPPFPFLPTALSLNLTPPLSTTNVQVKEPDSHGGESLGWV